MHLKLSVCSRASVLYARLIFASCSVQDHKSTVISLKKLIVREVAHEEKGLFLISMGVKDPEMVEVHASSREERNSWIQIIQDTINSLYVSLSTLLSPPCVFLRTRSDHN
jgi:hypothetical protein